MSRTRPQVREDLSVREGYHSPQIDVDVRLNTNEAPEPPPDAYRDALAAEMSRIEWHRYPERSAMELREALGALHGVGPEQVFAANGSNEVLQTLLLTYAGPGRRVATFEPTFAMYAHIARITGADSIEGERAADFSLDPAEVERVLSLDPAVTFLCSPNNPTAMLEDPALVDHVIEHAPGVVCVDEAYAQFADRTALDSLDEDRPLVVSRTFSKTWSMAGARLGYLVGPSWLVANLWEVVLPYHLDSVTQAGGRLALRFADEMDERVARLVSERERVVAGLAELPVTQWPSSANFVLFRPDARTGDDVWQALVDRSVLVRNCASWPRLTDCLRVTIGLPDENDRFLAALEEVLT
ncbi:MAG: histidinol-phosphate transaminase [Actinomycetota bacterium]